MEKWKDILGYEGIYQVSNFGRIKSLARIKFCGKNVIKGTKYADKILKPEGLNGNSNDPLQHHNHSRAFSLLGLIT